MRQMTLFILLMLSTITGAFSQNRAVSEQRPSKGKWWKLSVVALVVATSVDAHSSWGHLEANPALRGPNGRFGMKSIAIKGLITGGVVGAQYFMMRNHPKAERQAAFTNFALAGAFTGVATYNYRLHSR
jgi:hypothetical protein